MEYAFDKIHTASFSEQPQRIQRTQKDFKDWVCGYIHALAVRCQGKLFPLAVIRGHHFFKLVIERVLPSLDPRSIVFLSRSDRIMTE
jgi:hypothetical protein